MLGFVKINILVITLLLVLAGCSCNPPKEIPKPFNQTLTHTTKSTKDLENKYLEFICYGLDLDSDQCEENIHNIANDKMFGQFDLSKHPISNNELGVSSIDLYRINYLTSGVGSSENNINVSGLVIVPDLPKSKSYKGVILYYHPTMLSKYYVPSNLSDDDNIFANQLSAVFASQGYIVVVPDYIGYGESAGLMHPYALYADVNAKNGSDMLEPALKFLRAKGKLKDGDSLDLFVSAYSEGSAYALWFSKLYQEQKIKLPKQLALKKTVPISGVYDLSGVQLGWLKENVTTSDGNKYHIQSEVLSFSVKPVLASYAISTYMFYNNKMDDYKLYFQDSFYHIDKCVDGNQYDVVPEIFLEQKIPLKEKQVAGALLGDAVYHSDGLYLPGNNSAEHFVNPAIFSDEKFMGVVKASDIYDWKPQTPIVLVYLDHDSVVINLNSIKAYNVFMENGSQDFVSRKVMPNSLVMVKSVPLLSPTEVDHIFAMFPTFLIALHQFNETIKKEVK
jgi:hypothetical protein